MAHGYYRIDYEVIFKIITGKLPGFGKDIAKVLKDETRREKKSIRPLNRKDHALTFITCTTELDKEFKYG